jgi:hypothetical protein
MASSSSQAHLKSTRDRALAIYSRKPSNFKTESHEAALQLAKAMGSSNDSEIQRTASRIIDAFQPSDWKPPQKISRGLPRWYQSAQVRPSGSAQVRPSSSARVPPSRSVQVFPSRSAPAAPNSSRASKPLRPGQRRPTGAPANIPAPTNLPPMKWNDWITARNRGEVVPNPPVALYDYYSPKPDAKPLEMIPPCARCVLDKRQCQKYDPDPDMPCLNCRAEYCQCYTPWHP